MRVLFVLFAFSALAAPAAAGAIEGRVDLVDKGGKPGDASETVVYVEGVKGKLKPEAATVVMKGKQFLPRLTVVPVGSTVTFPNQDPIFHNVFSVSGANRFDLEVYKRPKAGSYTFQHPGVVRVYCNIHPQMSAMLFVIDSAHHARPAKDGTFTIDGVPPGRYTLRVWHERGGESQAAVEVPAQGAATARLALDASKHKRVQHKNKYGKDYSTADSY